MVMLSILFLCLSDPMDAVAVGLPFTMPPALFATSSPVDVERVEHVEPSEPSEPSEVHPNSIDVQELERFLDQFFAERMQAQHIPGLVIAVVKEGKLFFSKGYGYANLEQQIPVIPEQTVFRVGSISKLLTATAVMQLVEQGKLGLNDNVNSYLKRFQLQPSDPPVTIANLLTHTSGLDEEFIGIAARSANEILSPGDYLAEHLPSRMLPPNTVIRYSNHGLVLAGYLAELASGLPFTNLIQQKILQPLKMDHSSFVLRPDILQHLATGYHYKNGSYSPLPLAYSNDVPSAALNVTAIDIVHFIMAHLQQGRYGDTQLLQKQTLELMQQQHFTNHPGIAGQSYGFYEWLQNGQRGLMHDGEIVGFKSSLFLLPSQKIGWFVAHNNEIGTLQDELIYQFLNHYYPPKQLSPNQFSPPLQRASLSGRYRYIRYPRHTIDKVAAVIPGSPLFAPEFQVIDNGNSLKIGASEFAEVEPMLFQRVNDVPLVFRGLTFDQIGFRSASSEQAADLSLGKYAFEKLTWYRRTSFHSGTFAMCEIVFLLVSITYFGQTVSRYIMRRGSDSASDQLLLQQSSPWRERLVILICFLICFLNAGFPIGLIAILKTINLYQLAYGIPLSLRILLCLPIISLLLTIGLSINLLLSLSKHTPRNSDFPSASNWKYSGAIVFVSWIFILLLNNWNLLGFRF
jgi:CubicO group peptidase (beta-lactamase class C family)